MLLVTERSYDSNCFCISEGCPKIFEDRAYGCTGQYKIRTISLISHHEDDFGLVAEWNFLATSHGKTACDGIGGTVKLPVTKASLQ